VSGASVSALNIALLTVRYCASYVVGVVTAAIIASLWGGSTVSLVLYSLAVGAPFLLAALLVGLLFRRSVAEHPVKFAIAAPVLTALIWFPLANSADGLFSGNRLALYATFCGACCGVAFLASSWLWRFR